MARYLHSLPSHVCRPRINKPFVHRVKAKEISLRFILTFTGWDLSGHPDSLVLGTPGVFTRDEGTPTQVVDGEDMLALACRPRLLSGGHKGAITHKNPIKFLCFGGLLSRGLPPLTSTSISPHPHYSLKNLCLLAVWGLSGVSGPEGSPHNMLYY